ncbi:zinc finger, CCHC-type containing protein [Tanacetum coccineum]
MPRPKSLMPSSNEDQNGETLVETPIVRRSNRARDEIGPQYSYCYSIEEDPRMFDEAMQSRDVAFWKEAINDEMDSIIKNNTWILSDLPPDCKSLGFRQKEGIDYFNTYAPVPRIYTTRLLIALATTYNLVIYQMDVKTAFLNGDLENEVHMKKLEGFIMPGNKHKCDSAATLAKAYCQIYIGKSRHLGVRSSMVRELITNGVISVNFVRSQQNLADHLRKGLAQDLVHKLAIGMGLKFIEIYNHETPNSLPTNVQHEVFPFQEALDLAIICSSKDMDTWLLIVSSL